MRTALHQRRRAVSAITITIALVTAGAGSLGASAPPSADERIPDGSYTRVVTVDDGVALGLDREVAQAMTGPDGEMRTRIVIDGDRWRHYVTNDIGAEELGDLGTSEYDAQGNWVATSESSGCPGCVGVTEWSFADGELTLQFAEPGAPLEDRFVIEGTYHLEPAAEPERIPDGSYTRVATVEEGVAAGLDPELVQAMTGADGEMPLRIVIDGERFDVYVTNDVGVEELGDLGTIEYDADGNLVTTSESSGCPGCSGVTEWSFADGELTLRLADSGREIGDDERFVVEGTWVHEQAAASADPTTPVETVTLRFASVDDATASQVVAYLLEVQERAGGTIEFEFLTNYGGGETGPYSNAERVTIDAVADGTLDAAWVGARAFPAFDALLAPMLVDSYELQGAVFDAGIPQRMADSLAEPGIVGLAVLPGPLRRIVGVERPFLTAEDFSGQVIASDIAPVAESTIAALGATSTPGAQGLGLEGIDGVQAQFAAIAGNGYHVEAAAVTANLNFWPRPLVVMINPDVFESLAPEQQAAFTDAASPAVEPALDASREEDLFAASALCDGPIDVVEASPDELASVREAVEPVYADLAADPRTAGDLADIMAIKDELDVAPDTLTCPDGDA